MTIDHEAWGVKRVRPWLSLVIVDALLAACAQPTPAQRVESIFGTWVVERYIRTAGAMI